MPWPITKVTLHRAYVRWGLLCNPRWWSWTCSGPESDLPLGELMHFDQIWHARIINTWFNVDFSVYNSTSYFTSCLQVDFSVCTSPSHFLSTMAPPTLLLWLSFLIFPNDNIDFYNTVSCFLSAPSTRQGAVWGQKSLSHLQNLSLCLTRNS